MRFRVFLSAGVGDERHARWLGRQLAAFRAPRRLVSVRPRFEVVLSPPTEIAQTEVEHKLRDCQAHLVLCSAHTAHDPVIRRDVEAALSVGRARSIVALVAPDAPENADPDRDFYPSALAGRGLLCIDFRNTPGGDGRLGGILRLKAALLGVEPHALAANALGQTRGVIGAMWVAMAALTLGLAAASAVAMKAQDSARDSETQRLAAERAAAEAAAGREQTLAERRAEAEERASAERELVGAAAKLEEALRALNRATNAVIAADLEGESVAQALREQENAYWRFFEASIPLALDPTLFVPPLERIAAQYESRDRSSDAQRVRARLATFAQRAATNNDAAPEWRYALSSALMTIANQRAATDQNAQIDALSLVIAVVDPLCVDAGSGASIRAPACLRLASSSLARARLLRALERTVDANQLIHAAGALDEAMRVIPDQTALRTNGPALRDQLIRLAVSLGATPPSPRAGPLRPSN